MDVLIWGSGIAGSRLAGLLAESGHSVAVIPRGPASYSVLPGVGMEGDCIRDRSSLESSLLARAASLGATILEGTSVVSLSPSSGPVRSIVTDNRTISARSTVFADGSDPRTGRSRELLPDWEPWQLIHFAWQQVTGEANGFRAIAGSRSMWPWRGYVAQTNESAWVGVGWNLQCEMDSHIHVTELIDDVRGVFPGIGDLAGEPQVEVVPYEPRYLESAFCVDNLIAVGDLTGIVNPLSLRRIEISLKIAGSASLMIEQSLSRGDPVRFNPGKVKSAYQPFVTRAMQRDSGPPMPPVPRPRGRVGSLIQRMIDRK